VNDYTGKAPIFQKWDDKAFAYDTMNLHWQARLFYRALLQVSWHLTTRPDLPDDDAQLQHILNAPSDIWDAHKAAVRGMFTRDAETGVLWQKRLRADWAVLVAYREKQREGTIRQRRLAANEAKETNANGAEKEEESRVEKRREEK
jgi:uncharacterized protein YdaU (DUF1376 family)